MQPEAARVAEVDEALRSLEAWGHTRGWTGPDPYDALNARRLPRPVARSTAGRRVATQVVKRSPVDLRRLLGVPAGRSAATMAFVVSAYALGGDEWEPRLQPALAALRELRCTEYAEPCWGYHFDVQTRFFFYARGEPNTIATAFAGNALLDAYERTRQKELVELAAATGEFFLRHLPRTETDRGAYFGYLPADRTPIHNANMLVAALLARLHGHTGDERFRSASAAALAYTVSRQRDDGSWPYAEIEGADWVDGYHTGYVLDALMTCCDRRVPGADADALRRGLDFYRRNLFLADGTPRYTATSTYPIDIQSVAQGIQTSALAAALDPAMRELAWRVFAFAQARMRRPDGAYVFQRRRLWTNRTPHIRWGVAPMLLALTHLRRSEMTR